MERQFLTIVSLILISSCQLDQAISVDELSTESVAIYADDEIVINEIEVDNFVASNIWEYIIEKSSLDTVEEIDSQTLFYMNAHLRDVEAFNKYLNKSYYFIYYVVQELEAANLPVELALVPFIESNYDPFSISSSGAVGLWQFMPKTGRLFNLDKSWWTEDRHDPFRSTHAAISYFKYLLERFDQDIYLALAAYNAGPTFLDRQIRKNKRRGLESDFWSLNLSNQTSNYVPKYIAMKELIFNSEKYGINLPSIPVEPVVKKIKIPGQVEIITLSEYLDIKPELVYKLNAGYTKWASAPTDESIFYIPIEKDYLLDSPDNPFDNVNNINWISHVIERGDSLWKLAIKYDTEVGIIKQINYMNGEMLSIGKTLLIPLSKTKTNNFIPYEMHIVSEGDTLWEIGIKYNIDIDDLAKMNSLNKSSYLQLGQQLTIGNKNIHRNMDSKKRTILYSVKQGDNLYKISDLFDVSIKSIKNINNFENSDLMPGQIIKIAISAF